MFSPRIGRLRSRRACDRLKSRCNPLRPIRVRMPFRPGHVQLVGSRQRKLSRIRGTILDRQPGMIQASIRLQSIATGPRWVKYADRRDTCP